MDQRLTAPAGDAAPIVRMLVPDQRRCSMPDQALWPERPPKKGGQRGVLLPRVALIILWAAATAGFALTLYRVLSVETPTVLQIVFLVLSTLCFAWVAIGSATSVLGFVALATGRGMDTLALPRTRPAGGNRTALLFPVYSEEPAAVAATIDLVCRELSNADASGLFDIYILSDTQDPAARSAEESVYGELHQRWRTTIPVYVRWRSPNTGKKAGNIRHWIEQFGGRHTYFVVFDADSMMSAEVLLRLVAAMEEHPRAGLIQTVPRLVGGTSLFARVQQFAGGYYGRLIAAGLAAWHGPGGNYWGHNAIVRTQAFAGAAGLPVLPGAPPLGGEILSHDFVEAALLRRAGWEVHMVPSLEGSYEGCPPTISDLIVRDRRWAQGNLQHLRLLSVRGLPLLSRIHLAMGACAYLASPIWALTLIVGVVLALQAQYATPSYFGSEASLFPKWPVFDAQTALALLIATILAVHVPKLLGGALALRNREERRRNGGTARIAGGVLLESVLSTLIAPILMVSQTGAVLSILVGRDAGWRAQRRIGAADRLAGLVRQHRWHVLWGVIATSVCIAISPAALAWMSPILIGLLFAVPIALVAARESPRALGELLGTIEDRHPPDLLGRAHEPSLGIADGAHVRTG